tara:strand:- start:864 stop:3389 length:2526 start_codon:yes stop_codon:yes gene_type:complete
MPYTDLRFKAGINKEITPYSEENGWIDCDKVRFRFGYPEKLNGWVRNSEKAFLGQCRGLHEWVALSGEKFLGVGTEQKYYIKQGTDYKDITPLRSTGEAVSIVAGQNSSTLTITDLNHGCVVNDFVTFTTNTYDASASASTNALAIQDLTIGILSAAVNSTTNNAKALFKDTIISGSRPVGDITNDGSVGAADALEYTKYFIGQQTNATYTSYIENTLHPFLITNHTGGSGTTGDPGPYSFYFDNASSIMTGSVLSQEYQVTEVVDANTYKVVARAVSSIESITASGGLSFTPLVNDTWSGGIKGTAAYQIGTGLNTSVQGIGWGAGLWGGTNDGALTTNLTASINNSVTTVPVVSSTGITAGDTILIGGIELATVGSVSSNDLQGCTRGVQGTSASSHNVQASVILATDANVDSNTEFNGWGEGIATGTQTDTSNLRIWSHDNFGEDLIINERNGQIFFWEKALGLGNRAIELSTKSGTPTSVPQKAAQIMLSEQDGHVIAFGADALNASPSGAKGTGVQDPMLIRHSSQNNAIDWYPTDTNTADSFILNAGSKIVQAVQTRQQILVLTDVAIYAMQFAGAPFVFNIGLISSNITIMSPKSAIAIDDAVFWMGAAEFYSFAGAVQRIPCTVRDHVFNDFNESEAEKVVAGANVSFGEVWWFYPSSSSSENDSYVVYNYFEKLWYVGKLSRTAWLDRGISDLPLAAGDQNYLYNHETGSVYTDEDQNTTSFIESGDLGISDGNQFSFVSRVLPDLNFRETTNNNTTVDFILSAKNAPGLPVQAANTDTVTKTESTPVDKYTSQYQTRLRGRSFRFKIQSTDTQVLWRLGIPRVDIRPDGRR